SDGLDVAQHDAGSRAVSRKTPETLCRVALDAHDRDRASVRAERSRVLALRRGRHLRVLAVLEPPDVGLAVPYRRVQDRRSIERGLVVVPGTICDVDKPAPEWNETARESVEIDVGGRDRRRGRRRLRDWCSRRGRSRTSRNDEEQSDGARCARREPRTVS